MQRSLNGVARIGDGDDDRSGDERFRAFGRKSITGTLRYFYLCVENYLAIYLFIYIIICLNFKYLQTTFAISNKSPEPFNIFFSNVFFSLHYTHVRTQHTRTLSVNTLVGKNLKFLGCFCFPLSRIFVISNFLASPLRFRDNEQMVTVVLIKINGS